MIPDRIARTTSVLLLTLVAHAQDLPGRGVVPIEHTRPTDLDIPQPPKAVLMNQSQLPVHQREVVPDGGPGLPQPVVPPVEIGGAVLAGASAEDLLPFDLSPGSHAGGSRSDQALEPTVCSPDALDTLFATGNWYASFSTTRGLTWTYRNPYTYFPSLAGGFCCDQFAVSRNGATFWYLQYVKNTAGNAVRIAVSPDVASLRAGFFFPLSVAFTAQNFAFAAGAWLDFPDLATTNAYVFATSNVFDQNSNNLGRVVWRVRIADLLGGLPTVPFDYYADSVSRSWRLTHGAEDTMYWAYTTATNSIQVYKWSDASTTRVVLPPRTISSFAVPSGIGNAGPDGRPWSGRIDSRMTGGYYAVARFRETPRYGFYWTSDPIGTFPKVHARGVVFDAATDTVVEQPVVWNSAYGIAYPAVGANSFGHRGVSFAAGGGTLYPSTAFQIEDDLPVASRTFAPGSFGPAGDRWGDYMSVQSGGGYNTSAQFLCSGIARLSSTEGMVPITARLTRVGFNDAGIGIAVLPYPKEIDATIAMSPADAFGQGGAVAPYYRAVNFSSGSYTFTAPTFGNDPTTNQRWAFVRWHRKFAPGQTHQAQPAGQRAYVMATGNATVHTELVAEFTPLWDINLTSNVPVAVTLSQADFSGITAPSLPKTVQYVHGSNVTITAPATTPNRDVFDRWILDGQPQTAGVLTLSFTNLGANHAAQARYFVFQAGSLTRFGLGCVGTFGRPQINATTAAPGGLQIGQPIQYTMDFGRPGNLALLMLGVSNTTWNGIPLPLSLTPAGAPGCTLYHDPLFFFATVANPTNGSATIPLTWPVDRSLIGSTHYASYGSLDPAGNALGMVFSNANAIVLGGAR
jgi:hypothetical protein